MRVSSLEPKTRHEVAFSGPSSDNLPKESGCYVLTTHVGSILYIGESDNIRRRIKEHISEGEKTKETPLGIASRVHYKLHPVAGIKKLEKYWLEQYGQEEGDSPYFND